MRKNVRVKPGKAQSLSGFFIGIILCFIGLFVVIPGFGPFGLIWTLFAIFITIINGVNAFSNKGIATHEIIIEDDYNTENDDNQEKIDYVKTSEARLNELQTLYEKHMITTDEYEKKRKQILDDI